ncbi:MAG: hypothetical protein US25_C0061G0006 [Candidatus Moranbacteria bacterium GW2011_GWE1_36_7]|nr:MAG: hypothetical protein UR99_C0037G0009 [Candidatus Moranbacteria bacterium GW2011_GWD2_36_12]KKQ05407.1 MAG: hypothetical protein US16_C0035G0008 [Candidatus Moranbacteria bacterium GW2011_GWE2_36_40]KKQ12166.1 MAG: hypothetical protein US25_C0061G0006 [Candidatus Moranbacteria bacterium GW2011_GWE1_36_7]
MNDSQISKTIFFWTLVVLFWLTAAIIIGYAFGYRFNPQKGIFIYGGAVTIKTTPQEVDVYLDGILMPSKSFNRLNNSYHINGIYPGNYLLEVKAPNYQTWSKKISVHSGISTEFWNVTLTQNSYAREDFESPGIQKFFISPRKNLAAFSQQIENDFMVKIFDPGTLEINQVFLANDHVFTNDNKENIEWSPQAHRIIIPSIKNENEEKNYFIVTLDTAETVSLKEITNDNNLTHARWDPKNKNVMFYMSDDNLYRIDLDAPQEKKIVASHIASYDLTPKALFYFQLPEGIVYQTSFDGTDSPLQVTTSAPEKMDDNSYQIIVYDEDRIVFLNKNNTLFIYNKGLDGTYFRELSNDALGSQFSDDGKKLLFWNNHEISTYFVRKWEVQPIRNENELMPITKFSDQIENVQWTRDYEHVLFTNDKKIKLIEIDNRDHRNMMDVLSLNDNSSLLVNNFTDSKLYYTEKNDQGQNSLHAIYFPERTTFLQSFFPTTGTTTVQN